MKAHKSKQEQEESATRVKSKAQGMVNFAREVVFYSNLVNVIHLMSKRSGSVCKAILDHTLLA